MQLVPFRENIKLYWVCLLLSDWYQFFTHCTDFWPLNKISWVFFLPMFSRSRNVTVSLHILPILDHWKARLWMLNQLISEIMNVESVEKRDYECWIGWKARLWMLNWLKSEIMNVESVKKQYYKCWIGWKMILWMLNQFKVMEN